MSVESWLARSAVEIPAPPARSRRADIALSAGVFVALIAAILPLLRVVDPGWWVGGAVLLTAAVLATGVVSRALRVPSVGVALIEGAVWLLGVTAVFGGSTALLWVIPTPSTFEMVPGLVAVALEEIQLGAAPLEAGFALSFLIVASLGLLAVVMDHVVLTARMPLLAAIGLVAVSLIPSIAVPADIDLASFILLAGSILFLLRTDTRERQRVSGAVALASTTASARTTAPPAMAAVSATAVGIAAVAVIVALVATPLLPAPLIRVGGGGLPGSGAFIDPTLELGDDLRQPRELDVLSVRSTASNPPYLRAVTLTRFDGAVWEPDDDRLLPLDDEQATLPPVEVDADIELAEYRTTIDVLELNSPWLPVPYPATAITGLEGDWGSMPQNRTVATRTGSTADQAYEVTSTVPRPSLEQIRAREAAGGDDAALALPQGLPPIIAETANSVVAGTTNDYDALLEMQAWFRGPDFEYSLEAPVEDGFDGTGADAVARFLDEREGYCVHFASAFALMARTLGMPARVVVGYLPGTSTGARIQGQTEYLVTSSQLHAWPEVHFAGIGWVSFEPTKSLGTPTSFSAASPGQNNTTTPEQESQAAEPTSAPTPTASGAAPGLDDGASGSTGASGSRGAAASPAIGVGLLVLLALSVPAVLGILRRRRAFTAAAGGEPTAAWALVQDAAIDLGIPAPAAESPRAFGTRLVAGHGAPTAAMDTLVAAIERASYAEDAAHRRDFAQGEAYAGAVREVRDGLSASSSRAARLRAVILPRSLFVRPGSSSAGTVEAARLASAGR